MWTKILIFMIIFFLVASPATFKIMRGVLGSWVASAEGLATPAGLALHGGLLIILSIYLPRVLMTYEEMDEFEEEFEDEFEEEFEDEFEEEFMADYEGFATVEERVAALEQSVPQAKLKRAKRKLRNCPKCPKCPRGRRSRRSRRSRSPRRSRRSRSLRRSRRSRALSQPVAVAGAPPVTVAATSGPNPQAVLAPGAIAASSPTPTVVAAPPPAAPPPAPAGTTSPYFEGYGLY
jgi:hypothetical protein